MNNLQVKAQESVDSNTNKNINDILYICVFLLVLISIYKFIIPEIINIPVQKGYKAAYEMIEENLNENDSLQIYNVCCYSRREPNTLRSRSSQLPVGYKTKQLSLRKILNYDTSDPDTPDITYIYQFNIELEKKSGLIVNLYCGYNCETKEVVFFGTDDTYFKLEKDNAATGKYGSYKKVINSKFLSDIIEFMY